MKKLLLIPTIAALAVGVVGFSAFEAHIINVTAHIENALNVPISSIPFGTVFPEEVLNSTINIGLSSSFLATDQTRLTDFSYVIKQKPKCKLTQTDGSTPQYAQAIEDANGNFTCPAGYTPMNLLCPFLSKTSSSTSDISVAAFHGTISTSTWTDAVSTANEAVGYLSKDSNHSQVSTNWTIDLHAPCFAGQCAQDNNVPAAYQLSQSLNGQEFGCDLWIEGTNGKIGADLTSYVPPTKCDITVKDAAHPNETINDAIGRAVDGQTVCVPAGTYAQDVVINRSITLAGAGLATTIINGQTDNQGAAVRIAANNVTLEGFSVNGKGIAALWLNMGISGANVHDNHFTSASSATVGLQTTALTTQGDQSNSTFTNNEFTGNDAGQIAYVNGNVSNVSHPSKNVDFIHNTFDGNIAAGGVALGIESTNSVVTQNVFKAGLTSTYAIAEAWDSTVVMHLNNFDGAVGQIDVKNSFNGNTQNVGTLNAENNWWNGGNPAANVSGLVDFTPFAASAFPEN